MTALLLFIVVGVIAFIAMLFSARGSNKKFKQVKKHSWLNELSIALILILLVPIAAFAGPIFDKSFSFNRPSKSPSPSPYVQMSPKPSIKPVVRQTGGNSAVSNKIDCTGPDGVVFKTTQKECDDFNAAWGNTNGKDSGDEYIKCNIHANCGGGYREMKRSTCDEMICCQDYSFNWKFTSKSDCEQSREIYEQNLNAKYPLNNYGSSQNNSTNYTEELDKCISQASKLLEESKSLCTNPNTKTTCLNNASSNYNQQVRNCEDIWQ